MLMDGLELMATGMAVVFCFLAVLVAAMHASAALFGRGSRATVVEEAPVAAAESTETLDLAGVAVAVAAVMKHRETQKG